MAALSRHADHDPSLICRPAGAGLCDPLAMARAAFHLDRPCPRCGARFSWPCRTSSGKYRPRVHVERLAVEVQDALF